MNIRLKGRRGSGGVEGGSGQPPNVTRRIERNGRAANRRALGVPVRGSLNAPHTEHPMEG